MIKFRRCLTYFFTGLGYGAACYLCILAFANPGVAPTKTGVISVFILSGLIGILSMIFRTDLPLTIAIAIHLIGTFILFLIMALINNWIVNLETIIFFILTYVIIWTICFLEQKRSLHKINERIKSRNKNK